MTPKVLEKILEILATFEAFRNLDYANQRLYKSGLFRDAIDSHF